MLPLRSWPPSAGNWKLKRMNSISYFLELVTDDPKDPYFEPESISIRRPVFNGMGTIEKFDSIEMHQIHPGPLTDIDIRDILMGALSIKPRNVYYLIIGRNEQVWLGSNEHSAAKSNRKLFSTGLDGGNQVLECADGQLVNELLFEAIENDAVDTVKVLLSKDASVNARKKDGETALMRAAKRGKVKSAKLLIEGGANVEEIDSWGWSAADYAQFGEDWTHQRNRVWYEKSLSPLGRKCYMYLSEFLQPSEKRNCICNNTCKKEPSMWYLPKKGSSDQKPVLSVDKKNRKEYEQVQVSRPVIKEDAKSEKFYRLKDVGQAMEEAISRALKNGTPVWQLVKIDEPSYSKDNGDDCAQIWILYDREFDNPNV